MIFAIADILSSDELTEINSTLSKAEFVDGKLTAGWHAKLVKNNQQLKGGTTKARDLQGKIKAALNHNALFQTAVRPKAIHSILFSRYDEGMSYDRHVDNALMGSFYRSDVSFTLFLNSPEEYQGGELITEGVQDEKSFKLDAGSVLIYPSTTIHRVNTVTKGTRLVAVGWVQSFIRDAGDRELLFDLDTVR